MSEIDRVIEMLNAKIEHTKKMIDCGSYNNDIYTAKLETLEFTLFEVYKIKEEG